MDDAQVDALGVAAVEEQVDVVHSWWAKGEENLWRGGGNGKACHQLIKEKKGRILNCNQVQNII
jgi:hypothetical protein